jgi:hypothetical protein
MEFTEAMAAEHYFVVYQDGRVSRVLGVPGVHPDAVFPGRLEHVRGRVFRYHPSRFDVLAREAVEQAREEVPLGGVS